MISGMCGCGKPVNLANHALFTVNIKEAAKILDVHPNTLRNWEKEGRIKPSRIGSRRDRRYKLVDLGNILRLENGQQEEAN